MARRKRKSGRFSASSADHTYNAHEHLRIAERELQSSRTATTCGVALSDAARAVSAISAAREHVLMGNDNLSPTRLRERVRDVNAQVSNYVFKDLLPACAKGGRR